MDVDSRPSASLAAELTRANQKVWPGNRADTNVARQLPSAHSVMLARITPRLVCVSVSSLPSGSLFHIPFATRPLAARLPFAPRPLATLPLARSLATMTNPKPRALVFGLGSIGGVYAAALARSGACEVSVVARSNYAALKDKGLLLKSEKHGEHHYTFAGGASPTGCVRRVVR